MSETTISFTITGDLVLSLRKSLRPAIPKKAFAATTTVEVHVGEQEVTFSLPGASVRLAASTEGSGTIKLPWRQFQPVLSEPFQKDGRVTFAFAPGEFTLDRVKSRSKSIEVRALASGGAAEVVDDKPAQGVRGALGAPLLEAYRRTRLYGIQPTLANRALLRQQGQAEQVLAQALRLLQPLGVERSDLERILDAKAGLPRH